jgi:hypothetical protein
LLFLCSFLDANTAEHTVKAVGVELGASPESGFL